MSLYSLEIKSYIFKSPRLGFRNWIEADIDTMYSINSNPLVMEYFPSTQSREKTQKFIRRMRTEFKTKGFCYYAVNRLDDGSFIGFIGISTQIFKSDFTPCIDIGWRLAQKEWGKGYATEGAKRCLDYAFDDLNLEKIVAICPIANTKSEKIMMKLGMSRVKIFDHPFLLDYDHLHKCFLYEIEKMP